MEKNIFQLKGIGKVRIQPHPKSKSIRLSVRTNEVLVTFPPHTPFETVRQFVNSHLDWIKEHKEKLKKKKNPQKLFTPETNYATRLHKLWIEESPEKVTRISINNGLIKVQYPKGIAVTEPQIQEHIHYAIAEALRIEAKLLLPEKVSRLAGKHGFKIRNLYIKNNSSNWGSCSHVNNINLNLHLMRLPDHLIDYIILHELVHTKEKNHGPGFWAELNRVTNNKARELDREVKKYHPKIL